MKEVLRDIDFTLVAFYRNLLEQEEIHTFIRNENLSSTEATIPPFYPALCVVNEDDYARAIALIRAYQEQAAVLVNTEFTCGACGEVNPGTFEVCFACEAPVDRSPQSVTQPC